MERGITTSSRAAEESSESNLARGGTLNCLSSYPPLPGSRTSPHTGEPAHSAAIMATEGDKAHVPPPLDKEDPTDVLTAISSAFASFSTPDPTGIHPHPAPHPAPPWVENHQVTAARLRSNPKVFFSKRVEGLSLIADFITPDEESTLISSIEEAGWDVTAIARSTRQYGFRLDHKERTLTTAEPIPQVFAGVMDRLKELTGIKFTQLIINKYNPNQGIGSHIDDVSFGPVVAVVSLGDKCVLDFVRNEGFVRSESHLLYACSLLIMEKDARSKWRHGITSQITQTDGRSALFIRTGIRYSITFRTVVHTTTPQVTLQHNRTTRPAPPPFASSSLGPTLPIVLATSLPRPLNPGKAATVPLEGPKPRSPSRDQRSRNGDNVDNGETRGLVRLKYQHTKVSFATDKEPLINGRPIVVTGARVLSRRSKKILSGSQEGGAGPRPW